MSTFLSQARARSLRPGAAIPRPRLTIVPKVASRAPRIPFAVLVVTVLGAGLVGLLLLNTALQRGAYTVTGLQQTSDRLTLQQQNLETEVAALQSPQRISQRALRLGMVANDSPAFLSLASGRVVGVPVAGQRAQRPIIGITPSARPHHGTKLMTLVSGDAAGETTGVIKVPRQHTSSGRPSDSSGSSTNGKPANRPADTTNPSDTHGTSPSGAR